MYMYMHVDVHVDGCIFCLVTSYLKDMYMYNAYHTFVICTAVQRYMYMYMYTCIYIYMYIHVPACVYMFQ